MAHITMYHLQIRKNLNPKLHNFWHWESGPRVRNAGMQYAAINRRPNDLIYCAFQKHANSKVQKPLSQLRFSLPSIIITIPSNEPWNTETHITDRNPPITNHKPWPFELVKVNVCFLRGPLRWLTAAKNAIVSWLLNFRIRMFVKSVVNKTLWPKLCLYLSVLKDNLNRVL